MRQISFGLWTPLGPSDVLFRYAILAERNNFDVVWFPDHILAINPRTVCPDTWAIISAIGMKTEKVKLADAVSDPLRRHPSVLAQTVATVDQLTGGRVVLGMGAGEDMNLKPFGLSRPKRALERRQMLREAIHVIRKLWGATIENPANYNGQYFKLKDAFLSINPKQKWPPIYIGAIGPKTREIVGEIADGFYPLVVTAELFPKFLEDIKKGLKRAGRKVDEIDFVARAFVAISDDPEKARTLVIDQAKRHFILDGGAVLKTMGYDIPIEGSLSTMLPSTKTTKYIEELKSQIPDKAAESMSIFGTVDDCIGQVERFLKVGTTSLAIRTVSEETIVNFSEVIEYFRELDC